MSTLDGETAHDLGASAQDRLVDVRRRKDLVVEDDGEGLAHILLRDTAEAPRPRSVEGDVDVGAAVLVEALLGIGKLVA